jgi:DNA-binding CsgD family transcriptional regulator
MWIFARFHLNGLLRLIVDSYKLRSAPRVADLTQASQPETIGGPARGAPVIRVSAFENRVAVCDVAEPPFVTFDPAKYGLTPHEIRLLKLLAEGYSYKTAAAELGVSPHTVDFHLRNVYGKRQVHFKSEAVSKAFRNHLSTVSASDRIYLRTSVVTDKFEM